ncbi:unnamed protein product [Phytophthora lilii]|uniref:Unnamed protein product n=1 Tax=Phytophthora lilii TaxID=2077276 RepID=A0A9W6XE70_9STRA|nr:unnamed protein product [Phytophthora lilii]
MNCDGEVGINPGQEEYNRDDRDGFADDDENEPAIANMDDHDRISVRTVFPSSDHPGALCKRFGTEEDLLLAIQVNVGTPFTAQHGEIRKN